MKHFHHTLKVGCKNSELFLKQNTVFIDDAKKWLVAVLPPTTFVTITNQKCQLYQTRTRTAPEGLFPFKVNDAIAAGINALRQLKSKRCGELALRLSSRLTFAYLCVVVRANHLTVNMPLQIRVGVPRLSGDAEMRGPARGTMPTSICGSVSTVRFARSGRISFRLMAQRLEVSRG